MECGAMLDIRRKPKNAVKKIALNKIGSGRMSHQMEIWYMVLISNKPLGEGENFELIEMLRRYLAI